MILSTIYILVFVLSIVKSAPNSHLNGIPSHDELISTSKNSENGAAHAGVKSEGVPSGESQKYVDASKNDKDIEETAEVSQPEEGNGVIDYIFGGVRINWHYFGKILCRLICCKTDETDDESLDHYMVPDNLQESFDPRTAWPHCSDVISHIRNQGDISSCSIVASTSMLSDRLCIASGRQYKKILSTEDVMRCCKLCPAPGGYHMFYTLDFLRTYGAVTGGEYQSGEGCLPYPFLPASTDPNYHPTESELAKMGLCDHKCSNKSYLTPYDDDKYKITGIQKYALPKDTVAVKTELMNNGSCVTGILEYEDFHFHYKGGIYAGEHRENEEPEKHGVRLIGWGKENGIEYWLIANSWGKDWGVNGIAKLKKGCCGLGKNVWCVTPDVPT